MYEAKTQDMQMNSISLPTLDRTSRRENRQGYKQT